MTVKHTHSHNIIKNFRAALLSSVAIGALALTIPSTVQAQGAPCARTGSTVNCNEGSLWGGLYFRQGDRGDSSGASPSPVTEVVNINGLEGNNFTAGTAVDVRQAGNVTVNLNGSDLFRGSIQAIAGADGILTVAEVDTYLSTPEFGLSPAQVSAIKSTMGATFGIDITNAAAPVTVDQLVKTGVAFRQAGFIMFSHAPTDLLDAAAIVRLLPLGLPQSAIEGFIAGLPLTGAGGTMPAAEVAGEIQSFMLAGNYGTSIAEFRPVIATGIGGKGSALNGILARSEQGTVNVTNSAQLIVKTSDTFPGALPSDYVRGIRVQSGRGSDPASSVSGGALNVINTGNVTVAGSVLWSAGVDVRSGNDGRHGAPITPGAAVSVNNSGVVNVTGNVEAAGVLARSSTGPVSLTNSGDVSVTGTTTWAVGVDARSGGTAPNTPSFFAGGAVCGIVLPVASSSA